VQGIEGPVPPLGPAREGGELRPPVLPKHPAPARTAQSQEGEPEHELSDSSGAGEDTQAAPPASEAGHGADDDQPQSGNNSPIEH